MGSFLVGVLKIAAHAVHLSLKIRENLILHKTPFRTLLMTSPVFPQSLKKYQGKVFWNNSVTMVKLLNFIEILFIIKIINFPFFHTLL